MARPGADERPTRENRGRNKAAAKRRQQCGGGGSEMLKWRQWAAAGVGSGGSGEGDARCMNDVGGGEVIDGPGPPWAGVLGAGGGEGL